MKKFSEFVNESTRVDEAINITDIYKTLTSDYFDMWYNNEFLDFVAGNSTKASEIKEEIEGLFHVDSATAKKIYKTLRNAKFEDWFNNDVMDHVNNGKNKDKILKQIKDMF